MFTLGYLGVLAGHDPVGQAAGPAGRHSYGAFLSRISRVPLPSVIRSRGRTNSAASQAAMAISVLFDPASHLTVELPSLSQVSTLN